MLVIIASIIAIIKNLLDLHQKGYILKFSLFVDGLINTKWGKLAMVFLIASLIFLAVVMGTLMGVLYLFKEGNFLISAFLTYQLLYNKCKQSANTNYTTKDI